MNDFFFKALFHNVITDKLSDFCGLFIFPIFWSAVFPKAKQWVFILTGMLFVYWKSEYSSGLIEMVNTIFHIHRTVDASDLIALPVLLLAWFYIKDSPKRAIRSSMFARLVTMFIGAIAFFSFCATSQQRYIQSFDQPQYVLLSGTAVPDSNSNYGFEFYKMDSLLVVKVNELGISKPVRNDDFNKNKSIKELDQHVLELISSNVSLIPSGKVTELSISTPEGIDSLMFNGGRLDGRFSRTKNGKIILEGFYKIGLENGTWTSKDTVNNHVVVQTFVNGERTSVKQFDGDKLISSNSINTRADTIRIKYIHVAILVLCVAGIIVTLVRNFRSKAPEQLKVKTVWKWLFCFISPVFVWLIYFGIQLLLMDYNHDIFAMMASIIFICIATFPIMVILVFWIKLRKEIDVLLYCVLLGMLCSIWTTYGTILALSA
ncbi:MAG: hypothetical protein EOO87_04130 [Pedobacter sp.]|nr:MAG: hypothetical protein EOO87_04130 [Pedobacter sp.]